MALSSRTMDWIESLVVQEKEILTGDRLSIDLGHAKDGLLSAETVHFVRALHCKFAELAVFVNRRLPETSCPVSVITVCEGGEEFVVERLPVRLCFKSRPGSINFSCDRISAGLQFTGSIEARFGVFYEIDWMFLGARVTAEQIARHHLTELLQITAQAKIEKCSLQRQISAHDLQNG